MGDTEQSKTGLLEAHIKCGLLIIQYILYAYKHGKIACCYVWTRERVRVCVCMRLYSV